MKFTSIPEAYTSFYDALPYTVDGEGAVGDIEIVVSDAESGERLGTKYLYESAGGTVDIAPVLRSAVRYRLPEGVERCAVVDTGAQIKVAVTANGTAAPCATSSPRRSTSGRCTRCSRRRASSA